MTPTSALRLLLAMLGMTALLVWSGCRVPSFFEQQPSSSSSGTSTTTTDPKHTDAGKEAVATVTTYLKALDDRKFAEAYAMLSRDSQSQHSLASFEQQGKQGMPSPDLSTVKVETIKGDAAIVSFYQYEDPAAHGFNLVREDGSWKVVYRGGVPGSSYAENIP